MILRDDSNTYNSLYHLSLRWARADETNFTFNEFIQSLNMAINRITAVVMRHDKSWNWLDSNSATGLLDATTTITAGTSVIALSTPWLKISRIRIKLQDGTTWQTLPFKSREVVSDAEMASDGVSGYYLLGNSLYLIGVPQYTAVNSLEVQYQVGPVHFVPADTSKEVGFNPIFEELAALMPALDYLEINGPDEQARKVEKRVGVEPYRGAEGSGLLSALAVSYQERNDIQHTLSLQGNNRAIGLM